MAHPAPQAPGFKQQSSAPLSASPSVPSAHPVARPLTITLCTLASIVLAVVSTGKIRTLALVSLGALIGALVLFVFQVVVARSDISWDVKEVVGICLVLAEIIALVATIVCSTLALKTLRAQKS